MWLTFVAVADASCRMAQFPTAEGAKVVVEAVSEPLSCRRVTLVAKGGPDEIAAERSEGAGAGAVAAGAVALRGAGRAGRGEIKLVSAKYNGRMLDKHHIVVRPGVIEIGIPELEVGESAEIAVAVTGEGLQVILGDPPPDEPLGGEVHSVWTVSLDARHPGWGFADSALATTAVSDVAFNPDGRREFVRKGAQAQGILQLPPGSFTYNVPGARIVGTGSEGVVVTAQAGGMKWDAPEGGTARWRVSTVAGDVVIPDERTYLAGLDWRWSSVSLPEPAPPTDFRPGETQQESAQFLFDAVREMNPASLPGADPLQPRQLNKAWRSGFGSSVEQSLVLDRLLRQQRIASTWVLSGREPDSMTLTGYDRMFALVVVDEKTVPLDPYCQVCAFGEVSTSIAGKAALGGLEFAPLQAGRLSREITLVGTEYRILATLEGAAALWLREKLYGASGVAVGDRIGEALGTVGAQVIKIEGLETLGSTITIALSTTKSVRPPFDVEPPWDGGWVDL